MTPPHEWQFSGVRDTIVAQEWSRGAPRCVVVLSHGYGEHVGRYQHLAEALVRRGAAVYGPDHLGHGRSGGERALIEDFEDVVTDLRTVVERAAGDHPSVPIAVVGHSMGGMIAARYAQRYGSDLSALVLSGPILGRAEALEFLLTLDPIPDIPIDPDTLSRDPEVGKAYAADPLVWHGPFKRATVTAIVDCVRAINAGGTLSMPTLWIHGENDRLVPLADTRTGIETIGGTDLTERVYPGAEHEIFNELDRDAVVGDVLAFLDRAITG